MTTSTLTVDPLDLENWQRLARKRKIRLPRVDARLSTGGMTRWLRLQLGLSVTAFQRMFPDQNLREFVRNNPRFTLKAWAGMVLETMDYLGV